ncbi:MAG: protein-arginine deiminase family protein [Planctomycetota bacterium]
MGCSVGRLRGWWWVGLVFLTAGTAGRGQPPVWVSDADRDGVLDASKDSLGDGGWTWRHGAIVPVDLDGGMSDGQRKALARLLPIPTADAAARWKVEFDVPPDTIRVFAQNADQTWETFASGTTCSARDGLTLALTATRFADPQWDGRVRLTAWHDDSSTLLASVELRVAPFVMASSPQPAESVFVRAYLGRNDALVADLMEIVERAGAELHVIPGDAPYPAHHIWLQDAVEFGHAWTGRPDAPPFALPSNRNRDLDRFAETRLEDARVGVLTVGSYRPGYAAGTGGDSWIDWYGNLEASPPTLGHPFGRVIYGRNPATGAQLNPEVVAFLAAQDVQAPVAFDVGWLQIKHVDEVVSFLPADDEAWPYRLVVPDPRVAIDLLTHLAEQGHADAPMLSTYEEGATVASLLAEPENIAFNRELRATRLEPAYAALCEQLSIDPRHVIRLPVLFNPDGSARTPNVVNALVVNGHVVMADPDGPKIPQAPGAPGRDAFQDKIRELLADLPVEVHFVDDRLYHRWSGNVHCATNALRKPLDVRFPD